MMPGLDGIEVLKRIRREGITTPVLFLTARNGDIPARRRTGCWRQDDYLSKPFSTLELLARVRAMLRRKENYTPDILNVGSLALNRSTYELAYAGASRT